MENNPYLGISLIVALVMGVAGTLMLTFRRKRDAEDDEEQMVRMVALHLFTLATRHDYAGLATHLAYIGTRADRQGDILRFSDPEDAGEVVARGKELEELTRIGGMTIDSLAPTSDQPRGEYIVDVTFNASPPTRKRLLLKWVRGRYALTGLESVART